MRVRKRLAPRPAPAAIWPRQAFADQSVADAAPVHQHDPQLAAVAVLVAVDRRMLTAPPLSNSCNRRVARSPSSAS